MILVDSYTYWDVMITLAGSDDALRAQSPEGDRKEDAYRDPVSETYPHHQVFMLDNSTSPACKCFIHKSSVKRVRMQK